MKVTLSEAATVCSRPDGTLIAVERLLRAAMLVGLAELLEQTIRVWQPYYAEVLSPAEAVTMIIDVGRLFDALSSGS